ncbi:MAG: hypothetical protein ACM3H8_03745 [Sphingobacteriales bacterium]
MEAIFQNYFTAVNPKKTSEGKMMIFKMSMLSNFKTYQSFMKANSLAGSVINKIIVTTSISAREQRQLIYQEI